MRCSTCSQQVDPVVAIDLDGTLGDYHEHFLRFASGYFGYRLPRGWTGKPPDWENWLGLTQKEYREAKLAFRQGGLKRTMPVFEGAVNLVTDLFNSGAEVWITTTRPYNRLDSVDPDTQEWLRRNKIPYHHLLYDEHKYRRLADLVDKERVIAIVDDLPDQCEVARTVYGPRIALLRYAQHNTYDQNKFGGSHDLSLIRRQIKERIYDWRSSHE